MSENRSHTLPDLFLAEFSEFLAERIGLHFPRERWNDLERAMNSAAREFGHAEAKSCIRWLMSSPVSRRQIEVLASHLTVGETYFFREPSSFHAAETQILADLIATRRGKDQRLRIWSAGCSTGEEPYSIAILLDKLLPDSADWNITILATDINPRFLEKAAEGAYTAWSFRSAPAWLQDRYFRVNKSGRFHILPRIKRMVTFSYLNLAEDIYPALTNGTNAMDLIFCRNVLMYFNQQCAKSVIRKLRHCLVEGGWLIVSPVEASHVLFAPLMPVNSPGSTLYRKTAETGREIPTFGFPPEPPALTPIPAFPPQGGRSHFPFPVQGEEKLVLSPAMGEEKLVPSPSMGEGQGGGATFAVEPREEPKPLPTPHDEALALYQQGDYAEAANKAAGVLSESPDDARAMGVLARALANQGRLAEARAWCERAIASDKLNAGYHYLLATIQQECGQLAEASATLKRALYLDHDFALAHFALWNLARLQGQVRESEKHCANALSVLHACRPEDILPESEGMTAGRLAEIMQSMTARQPAT